MTTVVSTIEYQAIKDFRRLFWQYECSDSFTTSKQTSEVCLARHFSVDTILHKYV